MKQTGRIHRTLSWLLCLCMVLSLLPALPMAAQAVEPAPAAAFTPKDTMEFRLYWKTTDPLGIGATDENIRNCYIDVETQADGPSNLTDTAFGRRDTYPNRYFFEPNVLENDNTTGFIADYNVPIATNGVFYSFKISVKSEVATTRKFGGTITIQLKNQITGTYFDYATLTASEVKGNSPTVVYFTPSSPGDSNYKTYTPTQVGTSYNSGKTVLRPGESVTPDREPTIMTEHGYKWAYMDWCSYEDPYIVAADVNDPITVTGVSVAESTSNTMYPFIITAASNATPNAQFRVAFTVKSVKYSTTSTAYSNVFTIKSSDATLSGLTYQVDGGSAVSVPGFVSGTTSSSFDVELPEGTAENAAITLSPTLNDTNASITTNNGVTLSGGAGQATVKVTAQDGSTTRTYTVNFTVAADPGDPASLPTAADPDWYYIIYANGTPLLIQADGTGTTIYIDTDRDGELDEGEQSLKEAGVTNAPDNGVSLSNYTIYGGKNSSSSALGCDTKITMNSGAVKTIYGGCYNTDHTGNTSVEIKGGSVLNVYGGGGGGKTVTGNTSVTISGGSVTGEVHGGGFKNTVAGSTTVNISGGTVKSVYGGSMHKDVTGGVTVNITGGTVSGVSGGGYGTVSLPYTVTGGIKVNISGGTVKNNVYGGAANGTVEGDVTVTVSGGAKIGSATETGIVINGGTGDSAITAGVDSFVINGPLADTASIGIKLPKGFVPAKTGTLVATGASENDETKLYLSSGNSNNWVDGGWVLERDSDGNVTVVTKPAVDITTKPDEPTIYANGTALLITAGAEGGTTIYIDDDGDGELDNGEQSLKAAGIANAPLDGADLSTYTVYGGGLTEVTGDTRITMTGGKVKIIYGGGTNKYPITEGHVNGDTYVTIQDDAHVVTTVYGGGFGADVTGDTHVTISGGKVESYVYGGGYNCEISGSTNVTVTGGTLQHLLGGSNLSSDIHGTITVTISGGSVWTVSGMGTPTSDQSVTSSTVKVTGGTVGSVYNSDWYSSTAHPKTANLTVGGTAQIGKEGYSAIGVRITGGDVKNGVGSFAIDPDLTGENTKVYICLAEGFTPDEGGSIVATGAERSDLAKLVLTGDGAEGMKLELDNTNVKVVAESAAAHTHAVSVDCSTTEGAQVTFTEWNATDALPTEAGHYVLTKDITVEGTWTAPTDGETTLCLNGHTINIECGLSDSRGILVTNGAKLNICDCSAGETGAISVAGSGMRATSAICNEAYGTLCLYGGNISITSDYNCYGLELSGVSNICGGTVTATLTKIASNNYNPAVYGIHTYSSDKNITISGGVFEAKCTVAGAAINESLRRYGLNVAEYDNPNLSVTGGVFIGKAGASAGEGITIKATGGIFSTNPTGVIDSSSTARVIEATDPGYKSEYAGYYIVEPAAAHTHAVSVDCSTTDGDQVAFTEWKSGDFEDTFPSTPGNYVLAEDVDVGGDTWTISSGIVNLCLNGHTLTMNNGKILLNGDGTLNICDCSEEGTGRIENIDARTKEGIEITNSNSTFNLYGGNIHVESTSSLSSYTYGVSADSASINIYGGTITAKASSSKAAALNISSNTPKVKIYGGIMTAEAPEGKEEYGLYLPSLYPGWSNYSNYSIEGGVFIGRNSIYIGDATNPIKVTGGIFSTDPTGVIDPSYTARVIRETDTGYQAAYAGYYVVEPASAGPAPEVDDSFKNIYANGHALLIKEGAEGGTTVYADKGTIGAYDDADTPVEGAENKDLSEYTVYGGSSITELTGSTRITMIGGKVNTVCGGGEGSATGSTTVSIQGGQIAWVYGGGYGTNATINGSASVTIGGTAEVGAVYGGGCEGTVTGGASVTITGGTVTLSAYGSGHAAPVTGDTSVTMTGGQVKYIYGGGAAGGDVNGNTSVTVTGGTVTSVYGGGNSYASVTGTKTVTVGNAAQIGDGQEYGVIINNRAGDSTESSIGYSVDQFTIDETLTGSVSIVLPAGYKADEAGTVVAIDAAEGDLDRLTLAGAGKNGHALVWEDGNIKVVPAAVKGTGGVIDGETTVEEVIRMLGGAATVTGNPGALTIQLTDNVELQGSLNFQGGSHILDLKGLTLSAKDNLNTDTVTVGGGDETASLTITDSVGNGSVQGSDQGSRKASAVDIQKNGNLTLTGDKAYTLQGGDDTTFGGDGVCAYLYGDDTGSFKLENPDVVFQGGYGSNFGGAGASLTGPGLSVEIRGGDFRGGQSGAYNGSGLSLSDVQGTTRLQDVTATGGPGLSIQRSNVAIQGGTFTGISDAGLSCTSGTVSISGGTFIGEDGENAVACGVGMQVKDLLAEGYHYYQNGAKITDETTLNGQALTGTVTVSATVTGVTVDPATATVEKGSTRQFNATVNGATSMAVTWTVTGNSSAGTTISATGLLTVAADETAATLTVTAISTADNTKSGTAIVTIGNPSPVRYTITATAGEGGSISPSGKVHVTWNSDKTFTVTADSGYEIVDVLVDGQSVGAVDSYTFEKVTKAHTIEARFRKVDGRPAWNPFTDVPEGAWYYDSVKYVYEYRLMLGTSDTLFSPYVGTTRGMVVTTLWRMEGCPVVNYAMDFEDVDPGEYYGEAIRWAASEKVVLGYGNNKFGPNDLITREQMAVILYRYAGSPAVPNLALAFPDAEQVSGWAENAVRWAVSEGIISGTDLGTLMPKAYATRAQVATMLTRYLERAK